MFNSICNKKGLSLIEVLISLFLVSIGVLSLLSLQPSAWNLTGRSDFLGRAGGILQSELETNEVLLMNPNFPNPCATANPVTNTRNVFVSGQGTAQAGDMSFTLQTTIQDNLNNSWAVRVRVIWPGSATGITETVIVTRQESFRF